MRMPRLLLQVPLLRAPAQPKWCSLILTKPLPQTGAHHSPGRVYRAPCPPAELIASNGLDRQFEVDVPTRSGTRPCSPLVRGQWSSDITYIKTHEGWLYLSVVIDLFSRRVVGWSAQPRMTTDFALQALLAAVWRRKPKAKVMIVFRPQGSQFPPLRVAAVPEPAQSQWREPPRKLP